MRKQYLLKEIKRAVACEKSWISLKCNLSWITSENLRRSLQNLPRTRQDVIKGLPGNRGTRKQFICGWTLPEMQLSLHKLILVVSLLSRTELSSSEQFEIELKKPKDVFTIPSSKCDKKINYCGEYNAFKNGNCRCYCGEQNATFSFYNNSWTCLGNEAARSVLGKANLLIYL